MHRSSGNRIFKSNLGQNVNPFDFSPSSILLNLREIGNTIKASSSEAAAILPRFNSDASSSSPNAPNHSHTRSASIDGLEHDFPPPSAYASANYSNSRSHSPSASSLKSSDPFISDRDDGATGPMQRSAAGPCISPEREIPAWHHEDDDGGGTLKSPQNRNAPVLPLAGNNGGSSASKRFSGPKIAFGQGWTAERRWKVYVGFIVLLNMSSGLGMVIQQHILLWTGVYKFNYPIVVTVIQLLLTQCWFFIAVYLSRILQRPLSYFRLGFLVAPPTPQSRTKRAGCGWGTRGSVFEFEWKTAKQFLLVAFVFTLKILFSNLSLTYARLPVYQLSRILTLPWALVFTAFLQGRTLSVSTLSSGLTMTFCLFMASLQFGVRFVAEGFICGIISSVFVALYPFLLLRSYNLMLKNLNGTSTSSSTTVVLSPHALSGIDRRRGSWRLLNYITILSLMFMIPFSIVSGAAFNVWRTCYFLDAHFFWLMLAISGLLSFGVFASTLALVRCTSPLTAIVASAPREALQTVFLSHFHLQSWNWVGVWMCWGASIWYLNGRKAELARGKHVDDAAYGFALADLSRDGRDSSGGGGFGGADAGDNWWDDERASDR